MIVCLMHSYEPQFSEDKVDCIARWQKTRETISLCEILNKDGGLDAYNY